MRNRHLVIGLGEVGNVLRKMLECNGYDTNGKGKLRKCEHLHICIPYSGKFIKIVKKYRDLTEAKVVIIHSTVPIGTTKQIERAVHSPIRGVHGNMQEGIMTFVKYFGGKNAVEAARPFAVLGIKIKTFDQSETTEALKLWSTAQYGFMIMLQKEIYKWCEQNDLNYEDIYRTANEDYNKGCVKLGMKEVVRPWLKQMDGKIGGHCVIPNAKLLDSWLSSLLILKNKEWKQ